MPIQLNLKKDRGRVSFSFAPESLYLQVQNWENQSVSTVTLTKSDTRNFLNKLFSEYYKFMPKIIDKKTDVIIRLWEAYNIMEQHNICPEIKDRIKLFLKNGI